MKTENEFPIFNDKEFIQNFRNLVLPFLKKTTINGVELLVIEPQNWKNFVLSIRNMCEIYATNQNKGDTK